MLCSFRHLEVRLAKSDSINCTEVVTMIGASQFSAANSSGDRPCSSSSSFAATAEWCSITMPSSLGSSTLRYSAAFCSMIDRYGITTITRCIPCRRACFKAKAMPESVLPPPVGTVKEKKPVGSAAFAKHSSNTLLRNVLSSLDESNLLRCVWSRFSSNEASSFSERRSWPRLNCSVSRKSASTKQENNIRK